MSTEPRTAPTSGPARLRRSPAAEYVARWATDRRLPDVLAAGAMLVSGALLVHWLSRLTFWRDEWEFLLHRRGWGIDTFLDPAVEHLVAIPILIYKLLLEVVGMDSPIPYQLVSVATFLLSVGLLFIYVRARLGAWLALAAILPILFLGPAWDNLLFAYQVTWFGSVACGLGALMCLERDTRGWDIAATGLLIAGLLFSHAGIPFVAGATVEVALSPRRFRRAFVPVVPTVLWFIWYLGWGQTAETFISFDNVANLPNYVLDGLSSSLAVYLGLSRPIGSEEQAAAALEWGRPLLVLAAGLAAWRLIRLRRPPDRLLVVGAVLLGYWSLTALNASIFGLPTVGRYQYFGLVGLALLAAELGRGARIGRWVTAAILAVAVMSALNNYTRLRDAADGLTVIAQKTRGGLAALELARVEADPELVLDEDNSGVNYLGLVDAASYFSAVDAYGSPAYTPDELVDAPEPARVAADLVSGTALGAALAPPPADVSSRCLRVPAGSSPTAPLPAEGLVIAARGGEVGVALRRYAADSFPFAAGTLAPGERQLVRFAPDASSVPWTVQLTGTGRALVCPVAGARR